jgi:hypothetical protein
VKTEFVKTEFVKTVFVKTVCRFFGNSVLTKLKTEFGTFPFTKCFHTVNGKVPNSVFSFVRTEFRENRPTCLHENP